MAQARLIVAASESCADLLYISRFFAPDDFIWLSVRGRTHGYFSPLEIDRARSNSAIQQVHSLLDVEESLKKRLGRQPAQTETITAILRVHKVNSIEVPHHFSIGLAKVLEKERIKINPCQKDFFPERQIKQATEIKHITTAQRMAEAGLMCAKNILKQSRIAPNKCLFWKGQKLTSEILRGEIDSTIIKLGGLPAHTIVAGGIQACDPHESGHGPLHAHESIIIDIFPRDQKTGYFGDLTRTYVKGRPAEKLTDLYKTVQKGQKLALKTMKAGIDGGKLHARIVKLFEDHGYHTEKRKGRWVGFFHGTGHSVGLEIHESPRFGRTIFKAGHVMTVEPGLYYPSIGGVRLEDLVVITKSGIQNLTRADFEFEL
jgi:Xaa-Pro aminopeptidase